jgi:hypothetical protein
MKFLGIVVERRLNYNDILKLDTSSTDQAKKTLKKPNNKNIKKSDSVQLLSSESMGVGIVEPAKNVLKLLNYAEEHLNANLK